jgi:hypothetical protein
MPWAFLSPVDRGRGGMRSMTEWGSIAYEMFSVEGAE